MQPIKQVRQQFMCVVLRMLFEHPARQQCDVLSLNARGATCGRSPLALVPQLLDEIAKLAPVRRASPADLRVHILLPQPFAK